MILAAYTAIPPRLIRFDRSRLGRPELAAGPCFSCSGSGAIAVVAVSGGRRVGVDVERIRPIGQLEAVAAAVFTAAERATLQAVGEPERHRRFFALWTRKEAYLKARGVGLTELAGAPPNPSAWSLERLGAPEGYAAALAVEGRNPRLRCLCW